MAFIRKKKIGNKIYYYVVENKVIKGKTMQKVLYYIGTAETLLKKLKVKH